MHVAEFVTLLKESAQGFIKDNAPRLGAALAYYSVFSSAPLLIVVIAVSGLLFGKEAVSGRIIGEIEGLVGRDGALVIQSMIAGASNESHGLFSSLIGLGAILLGASGVIGELKEALNTIWEIQPKPGSGVWKLVRDRFFSITMILGIGFVFLVSLVVSAVIASLQYATRDYIPGPDIFAILLDHLISIGVITFLIAILMRYLPDALVPWRDVRLGALLTAVLFVFGKYLLGFYLGTIMTSSSYGAAGSVVIILLWMYYSAQIFLFGAEFTKAYALKRGSFPLATSPTFGA